MTDRLSLFKSGLQKSNDLLFLHPENTALLSISKQIAYLIELEQGVHSDRTRFKNITIGVLTAREIEAMDKSTEIFYQIANEARYM